MAKYPDDSQEEAEDLLSEVFIKLVRYPPKLTHSGDRATAALSCWITKTVASCAIDRQRTRAALKRSRDPAREVNLSLDGEKGICDDVGDDEKLDRGPSLEDRIRYRSAFDFALSSLKEDEALFIRKHYQEELTLTEAARTSGIKPGQAKGCLLRFKEALAQALQNYSQLNKHTWRP